MSLLPLGFETDAPADAGRAPIIVLEKVGKRFLTKAGEYEAFADFDLTIREGEFVCLLGPSGCGKTSLLRILAGLDSHNSGILRIREPKGDKPFMSVVFQENSIFPWLSVRDNVAYGLRSRQAASALVDQRVDQLLETVGLTSSQRLYPHQLSGGMKQRVSIARAFANDPQLLLMDEPFSALDEQNRSLLQEELLRIWSLSGKTVLFITHSIDEALFLGDRVVVMGGRPGHVMADISVPFPRPRQQYALKASPAYGAMVAEVAELIRLAMQVSPA